MTFAQSMPGAPIEISTNLKTLVPNGYETPLAKKPPSRESLCWNVAKVRFRAKMLESVPRPSEENIERFLKNKNQIDETISECQNLKAAANRQYSGSTSSRFIGKLLEVLVVVKNVGDPLLQCAPESVSIAWSAISLLIGLGVSDLENCGRISEACASIVTIVLNCRLYENRYQEEEANSKIIESVQELLTTVLDFFWLANKKLRDKKIKRLFKDIFDSKVDETYQDVMTRYKALREDTDLAFQEKVMESLLDMKNERADLIELLFPALKDITTKLEDITDATKEVLTEIQVRDKFKMYRKSLKPTNTHIQQLEATLQPLQHGTAHLCQWLFKHPHYQTWEHVATKSCGQKDNDLTQPMASVSLDGNGGLMETPSAIADLLYVKGRAGFGKSVMMATVIERLRAGHIATTDVPTLSQFKTGTSGAAKNIVLFFFFKRGDDSTQLTARAFSSLASQLFHEEYAKTKEEMESFINAIDSLRHVAQNSEKDNRHTGQKDTPIPDKESVPATGNQDLRKVESIAAATGKPVYIVVDGIDECTDYESEGLVKELVGLGRSKKAMFKIMMSSRENMDLEQLFVKDGDEEGRKKMGSGGSRDPVSEMRDPFHCVTHDDTIILTVSKETNSEDMKAYLNHSLREVMTRRLPGISRLGKRDPRQKKLIAKIKGIADNIQQKSDGMFTYSAMVITNISQPSPLSLLERLKSLPNGMNELYSRQLEALTGAQRKLVTLALKRIVWSPTEMGTVEIAEEFKQIYLKEHDPEKDDTVDDYDSRSVDGSESEGEEEGLDAAHLEGNQDVDENQTGPQPGGERPYLTRTNTYHGENPIEKAMRDPEMADTIYHLENAGRDFFKFSNEKRIINFIHKSVRDWFESESAKAAQRDYSIKSVASLFSHDSESGELKLTLPIPWIVVKGQAESMEFQSEKDAHLDILIYIWPAVRVLVHPRFREVYTPYPDLLRKALEDIKAERERKAQGGKEGKGEGREKEQEQPSALAAGTQDYEANNDANGHQKNEDTDPREASLPDDEDTDKQAIGGFFKNGPVRCEIHQWIHHMKRLGHLWPREERSGQKWTELETLIRKFKDPEVFKPWCIHYYYGNDPTEPVQNIIQLVGGMSLVHLAAANSLEVLLNILMNEPDFDGSSLGLDEQTVLNYQGVLYFPELIKVGIEKDIDINLPDKNGNTPLTQCLNAEELQEHIDYESEPVKNLILSIRHLLNNGANIGVPMGVNASPALNFIIKMGSESLFDLAMANNPILPVQPSTGGLRTPLHVVWHCINLPHLGRVSIARKLLEAGANPNAQDRNSRAPLYDAVIRSDIEGVRLLLEEKYQVDIDDEDVEGHTALIGASADFGYLNWDTENDPSSLEVVKLLLEHRADLKLRAKNGWTALMFAIWHENWDIAEVLVEAHAKEQLDNRWYQTMKDINDETILHLAMNDEDRGIKLLEMVFKKLTEAEKSEFLEQKELVRSRTALHKAVSTGCIDFASYLLECGANPHTVDSEGESVGETFFNVWLGRRKCHRTNLSFSWETWADLYCKFLPPDRENAFLHQAISTGNMGILKKLAESGIDPLKKDSENWDAFDWAYTCGRQDMMQKCFPNIGINYQDRIADWRNNFAPITGWSAKRSHPNFNFSETSDACSRGGNEHGFVRYNLPPGGCDCPVCSYLINESTYSTAFTNHPVSPYIDVYYFEITILKAKDGKKSGLVVGLVGEGWPSFTLAGWDHKNVPTFGFDGNEGLVHASSIVVRYQHGVELDAGLINFGVGDTVGCGYDNCNHTIFWTLNGRYLGGYKGLVANIRHRLYPTVGTDDYFSSTANFGNDPTKPFKWNGSRELEKKL
ncbi:hypothetical protein TWF730_009348 [Orbilia blumenaviensis]|uniref:B30.2/SPRY domain-containing protein n=1 Tax=Orbilia blumenaviensis TaxID=1796055 RepID=A0AAV9V189_9PEZI